MKKILSLLFIVSGISFFSVVYAQSPCQPLNTPNPSLLTFHLECYNRLPFTFISMYSSNESTWHFNASYNSMQLFIDDSTNGGSAAFLGTYPTQMQISKFSSVSRAYVGQINIGNPQLWIRDNYDNSMLTPNIYAYYDNGAIYGSASVNISVGRSSTFTVGDAFGTIGTFSYIVDAPPVGGVCGSANGQTFSSLSTTNPNLCSMGTLNTFGRLPVCDVFESSWMTNDGSTSCGNYSSMSAPGECFSCRTTPDPGWTWTCKYNNISSPYCTAADSNTTGTISVSSNISTSWTITGPATITGSGASQSSPSWPTGTYTITWGNVSGYATPATQSLTLTSGGTISFNGIYAAVPTVGIWFSVLDEVKSSYKNIFSTLKLSSFFDNVFAEQK